MTNRVQTNRNFATGGRPSTGTRKPGELYLNVPELQLGLIDAAQTPQDMLAMRFFSQTASYPVGAFIAYNGVIYTANTVVSPGPFNPAQWSAYPPATQLNSMQADIAAIKAKLGMRS